jgi:glyoxylase-like metal-dependent hydrolase (beta-lactamase superfamily II)
VEEVVPGVHRIPVRMPGDALAATNVYAIVGESEVGLVDGGWFVDDAVSDLEAGLRHIGAGFGDVASVAVTHAHPDHYTLAVELRRRTGCATFLGAGERTTVEAMLAGTHGLTDFAISLRRCGVPDDLIGRHLRAHGNSALFDLPSDWLTDGDVPLIGGRPLHALATPGHTRGHFCFAEANAGLLFAGDHVLPTITPSIGFETVDDRHLPLADYLDSLARLRGRPDATLLPAHGPVAASVHARVDELLHHHDVRLAQCGDALAGGARTAYEVATQLPWTRHERRFDELSGFDRLMAVHETRAHLAVLDMRGRATVAETEQVDVYVLR